MYRPLQGLSGSADKEFICNAGATGDMGLIPGLGRSPRERNSNPFQYSFLKNPMNRGAWQAIVQRVAKSWKRLRTHPTHHRTLQNRGQHFSWNLPAGQRRMFWVDSAKKRKSGREGKVSIGIKLQLPSEQVLWGSQIGGCVFGRFKYSTGVPRVFMAPSQAEVVLGRCLLNSWPALLWQQSSKLRIKFLWKSLLLVVKQEMPRR